MNTRNLTSLCLTGAVAATLTLMGCSDTRVNDPMLSDTTEAVDQGTNAGYLGVVPPETRRLILQDLEGKQITGDAELLATDAGTLYKVNYYENGTVRSRTYNREGLAEALPSQRPTQQDPLANEPIRQRGAGSGGAVGGTGGTTGGNTGGTTGGTTGGATGGGQDQPEQGQGVEPNQRINPGPENPSGGFQPGLGGGGDIPPEQQGNP